jgi:chromosome partitioning protein
MFTPVEVQERLVRTIAIINQKGGCGKTTTAINLAGVFARAGRRTLLVDIDPQSHCAAGLAIPEQRIDIHIGDAMLAVTHNPEATIDWTRLLWRVSRNLDLAPSTVRLAALESARSGLGLEGGERRLDQVLTRVADQYDLCLIDCPPSIGMLTFNALYAAKEILIPVETGFFALEGTAKQMATIRSLARRLGTAPCCRIVATLHDEASTLQRDILEELHRRFDELVAPVVIRIDPRLRESVRFGQPAGEYAPESTGSEDYTRLGEWLLSTPPGQGHRGSRTRQDTARVPGTPSTLSPAPRSPQGARRADGGEQGEQDAPAGHDPASGPTLAGSPATGSVVVGAGPRPSPSAFAQAEDDRLSTKEREAVLAALSAEVKTLAASVSSAISASPPRHAAGAQGAPNPARPTTPNPRRRSPGNVPDTSVLLGAHVTPHGVRFEQPLSIGSRVYIAGEFNQWSPTATPMLRNEQRGVFELTLALPPGRVQYRLVVDGRWSADPYNPDVEINPFGEPNSFVVVPEAQAGTIPSGLA